MRGPPGLRGVEGEMREEDVRMNKATGHEAIRAMMHAVGYLEVRHRYSAAAPWRNYYATGNHQQVALWEMLCGMGLATRSHVTEHDPERPYMPTYSVTPVGIAFLRARRRALIEREKAERQILEGS